MSCILKISVDDLAGKNIDEFLDICMRQREDLVDIDNFDNSQWKHDTGTKDAFAALLDL